MRQYKEKSRYTRGYSCAPFERVGDVQYPNARINSSLFCLRSRAAPVHAFAFQSRSVGSRQ